MAATVRPVWTDEPATPRRGLEAWLPPKPRELICGVPRKVGCVSCGGATGLIDRPDACRGPTMALCDACASRNRRMLAQLAAQQAGASTDPNRLADAEAERIPDWAYTGERP